MSLFQPEFAYSASPQRVVFAPGGHNRIAAEVAALGRKRALVLTTPEQAASGEVLAGSLGGAGAGVFSGATMHTPVEVTERALGFLHETGADCLVAIGGGSTIGLSKALALRTGLPQVAIPTSFAGSEATGILGQTEGGKKTTLTDPRVRPAVILYDVTLVRSLPSPLIVSSGMNAIAHAVEGLYARDRNPISSLMALEGIRALASALPRLTGGAPGDADWGEALYGAWLCGTVLGQVGMALHHKLCHALGGGFNLPHAETHAVILPHAVAYTEFGGPGPSAPGRRHLWDGDRACRPHQLRPPDRRARQPRRAGIDRRRPAARSRPVDRQPLLESPTRGARGNRRADRARVRGRARPTLRKARR